jgi:phosphoribosylanthranilate isomerase
MIVKICGIKTVSHALTAARHGADLVGIVFVPGRRRMLDLAAARSMCEELRSNNDKVPEIVGLFSDQSLEEVNYAIDYCSLDMVQLCGNETLSYCDAIECKIIKVIQIPVKSKDPDFVRSLSSLISKYSDKGYYVTLDSLIPGYEGGTGQSFDWSIAATLAESGHSFILAGGLNPVNVSEAIKMVKPFGVDVSSGIETNGEKDPSKIKAFISQARISI